jgi:hypothetical protein
MARRRAGSRATARARHEPSDIWKRFAIAGAALIAVAGVLATCSGDGTGKGSQSTIGAAFAASTVSDADIAHWYTSTQDVRIRIATSVAVIRRALATQDGLALRPACTVLADEVTEARAVKTGPDIFSQSLFDAGLNGYGDGVTTCGSLFDGTQVSPGVLQQRIRAGLDDGDRQWLDLAAKLALPVATASPVATPAATSTPRATPSRTTARATARATARPLPTATVPPAAPSTAAPTSPPTTVEPAAPVPSPSAAAAGAIMVG